MSYHDDPTINDTLLSVINDGNGEMCGFTYQERVECARQTANIQQFRLMARNYSSYRNKHFGSSHLTRHEWVEAGNFLSKYYMEHLKEIDNE